MSYRDHELFNAWDHAEADARQLTAQVARIRAARDELDRKMGLLANDWVGMAVILNQTAVTTANLILDLVPEGRAARTAVAPLAAIIDAITKGNSPQRSIDDFRGQRLRAATGVQSEDLRKVAGSLVHLRQDVETLAKVAAAHDRVKNEYWTIRESLDASLNRYQRKLTTAAADRSGYLEIQRAIDARLLAGCK